MSDAVGLLASAIGLVLIPVCLARLVLGRADLAALYRAPRGDGWPRGVQEEDCPRWRPAEAGLRGSHPDPDPGSAVDGSAPERASGSGSVRAFVQPTVVVQGRVGLAGRRASAT